MKVFPAEERPAWGMSHAAKGRASAFISTSLAPRPVDGAENVCPGDCYEKIESIIRSEKFEEIVDGHSRAR